MNYRHIYHAGNVCDVVKHAVYALLLAHMKEKDKGFAVLDTHAGCGLYDLQDERAQKTNEAAEGILKLWATGSDREELAPYLSVLRGLNPQGGLRYYPGSPLLARTLLRPQDRLIACELHPEDYVALRRAMGPDNRVQLHERDGYGAIKAFMPFPEKRGLVLIDPPFETADEIDRMVEAAQLAISRMNGACLALWYPIKERPLVWRLHEKLREAGLPKILVAEFVFRPELRHDRLNGTGMVILNPPWKLPTQLEALFPLLHAALETESRESRIEALTPL